jgi:hypothetical protein
MDAKCSEPFKRTGFKHERLKDYILDRRRELLRAVLTLARAWFAAGRPKPSVTPLGSFEHWTEVIGGILQYAGIDGFMANSEEMYEQADSETVAWESFLQTVNETFYGEPFTIAELWEKLNEKTCESYNSPAVLSDRAEQIRAALPIDLTRTMDREGPFKQRLGLGFRSVCGRRFGRSQSRVEKCATESHNKVVRWKVVCDE